MATSDEAKNQWEREVINELRDMKLEMSKQTTMLGEYISQLKQLQEDFKPIQRHVIVIQAIGKGFLTLVAVGASVKLCHDAYQYLFN